MAVLSNGPDVGTSAYDLTIVASGGAKKSSSVYIPPRSMCNGTLSVLRLLEVVRNSMFESRRWRRANCQTPSRSHGVASTSVGPARLHMPVHSVLSADPSQLEVQVGNHFSTIDVLLCPCLWVRLTSGRRAL